MQVSFSLKKDFRDNLFIEKDIANDVDWKGSPILVIVDTYDPRHNRRDVEEFCLKDRVVREAVKVAGEFGASDETVLRFAEEDIRTQIALTTYRSRDETVSPRKIKVNTGHDSQGNPLTLKDPSFWEYQGQLYLTGQWGTI